MARTVLFAIDSAKLSPRPLFPVGAVRIAPPSFTRSPNQPPPLDCAGAPARLSASLRGGRLLRRTIQSRARLLRQLLVRRLAIDHLLVVSEQHRLLDHLLPLLRRDRTNPAFRRINQRALDRCWRSRPIQHRNQSLAHSKLGDHRRHVDAFVRAEGFRRSLHRLLITRRERP